MTDSSACLEAYAEGIRALVAAGCVSLYVPVSSNGGSKPKLHHCGTREPVPELRNQAAARSFVNDRGNVEGVRVGDDLVVLPSADEDSGLIALPAAAAFGHRGWSDEGARRRRRSDADLPSSKPSAWLGIRLRPGEGPVAERLAGRNLAVEVGTGESSEQWWNWLLFLGSALAAQGKLVTSLLRDPLTGLADRRHFQSVLKEQLTEARKRRSSLTLVFINPDNFAAVNERFGRDLGDRCVKEISVRLRRILRGSDLICRYGGVIFAAILGEAPSSTADKVAQRLCSELSKSAFAEGGVQLEFSIGFSHADFSDGEASMGPTELVRQADQALSAAKRCSGSSVQRWRKDSVIDEAGSFDRLAGIFTGNMSKDYRNMVLLRDTASVIALHADLPELATEVVEVLDGRLAPHRIGLYGRAEDGELRLWRGLTRSLTNAAREEQLSLDARRHRLLSTAFDQRSVHSLVVPAGAGAGRAHCYAIPLVAGEDAVGCIYLEGLEEALLDESDLLFFKALGSQVAVALDRARLAKAESERRQAKEESLRAELRELRHSLSQTQLVYRSSEMERLVTAAHRAAATDATVLITGDTGTGKELLARTIHELGPRGDQPFVVVDCGAIPGNLIENELFGHEKGAFTGADVRSPGRLEAAGRGTVLLDEIGELPLEVQSRLLRFVQEKEFTRVGGSQVEHTAARILAATNRDLDAEVEAGRFRADLYHRLRVIVLDLPPLRKRPDDILPLAHHFLEAFKNQYQKESLRLSDEAERWLLDYRWPGNVRELKHRILRAVVLVDGNVLTSANLDDFSGDGATSLRQPETATAVEPAAASRPPSEGSEEARWRVLRADLRALIEAAVAQGVTREAPLVKCLTDQVLLRAHSLADGVGRRTARLLDLPESTCRRRLDEAEKRRHESPHFPRAEWERVERSISRLVDSPVRESRLWQRFEDCFLTGVLERFPSDPRTAAGLVGVGTRTFRRRAAKLRDRLARSQTSPAARNPRIR